MSNELQNIINIKQCCTHYKKLSKSEILERQLEMGNKGFSGYTDTVVIKSDMPLVRM